MKFSIIIPTSKNYASLKDSINKIKNNIPENVLAEIILVQDISNGQQMDVVSGTISNNPNFI